MLQTGSAGLACIIERIGVAMSMPHNTLPWTLLIEATLHPIDIGYDVQFASTRII